MSKIISLFDDKSYARLALNNREKYQKAKPFPHIVLDDFLPIDIAQKLAAEYPSIESSANSSWRLHKNNNTFRYFIDDSKDFPDSIKLFSCALQQRSFISFLETISGIDGLISDPYYIGGGAMSSSSGGFLNIHADFNWHQKIQSWRRLNILFYLTPNWNSSWEGNLELWSKSGDEKIIEIEPIFNRAVIFSTKSNTFHGQPVPLKTPKGVFRSVFSAFYYSTNSAEGIDKEPHFTKYNKNNNKIKADYDRSPYSEDILKNYLKDL